jgi:hypothetical protein
VTPKAEDCATAADDDCNGTAGVDEAAGCVCLPGAVSECYSGAEGTKDVGVCGAGVAVCDASGKAYGPCEGEIAPSAERCGLPAEDETCDGEALCTGEVVSAERAGDAAGQLPRGLAITSDGSLFLTGMFSGSIQFGDIMLSTGSSSDFNAFVYAIDPAGDAVWGKSFGDVFNQLAFRVATDAAKNPVVIGDFVGEIKFGADDSTKLASAAARDIFVAKLDAQDGHHLWSRSFPGQGDDIGRGVAVDAEGNTLFCGSFSVDIDLDGEPGGGAASAGANDLAFGKLDKNGDHVWSLTTGSPGNDECTGIAVDAGGNVFVAGYANGELTIQDTVVPNQGAADIFIAKFSPSGSLVWAKPFGSAVTHDAAWAVTTDKDGNVVFAGQTGGTVDFGGGPLTAVGSIDAFVAKLDTDGNHIFSRAFGGGLDDTALDVAVDAAGNVLVTGVTKGAVDFGGGLRPGFGAGDIFAVKLGPKGEHAWSAIYGSGGQDDGRAIRATALGGAVVTGTFTSGFKMGKQLLHAGGNDAFLARLKP